MLCAASATPEIFLVISPEPRYIAAHLVGCGVLLLTRRSDGRGNVTDLVDDSTDGADRFHRVLGVQLDGFNLPADILGGFRGFLGQFLHLIGHHRKPFPASPARAASIVAFKASKFVC